MIPEMLTKLWIAAFLIRAVAIIFGKRKSPLSWLIWAGFVECLDASLFDAYAQDSGTWYTRLWVFQQLGSVILLGYVVRYCVKPALFLVWISLIFAAVASLSLWVALRYPGSPIEPVMEFCGGILLALGLASGVTTIARPGAFCAILSAYLCLSAVLMLVGGEFLSSPGLGRAIAGLDCAAFGAWAFVFVTSPTAPVGVQCP